ncbi:MAG: beta-ketoacyl-[acyl-carrier-protein] synthase family protein [Clostridiales bacterium]|jgi:3-oxoacyl-[acyl-carrier-protein] synthase II|nr:beta-ketoacyl-[acyl-carrier-protein] synthase family protein [Clostridiales bacterium]
MKKQIVITGYGVLSSLGKNKEENKARLFAGKGGISDVTMDYKDGSATAPFGAINFELEEDPFFKERGIKPDRVMVLALQAANECIAQAKINAKDFDSLRLGVVVGTAMGGIAVGSQFQKECIENGVDNADPVSLAQYPLSAVADIVATRYGFNGTRFVVSTACASGANALGIAHDIINDGLCDIVLAGGVDPLSPFSFAGFKCLGAISRSPCQPYSASSGINIGEGAAFFILESDESAKRRNADIVAELRGYSLSADAYHATAPDPNGQGAYRCMKNALKNSGFKAKDIDYVNGHGTGTPANDMAEKKSWKLIVGEHTSIPLISNKSMIGHCMGAAGAIEAAFSLMSIEEGKIPPTTNFRKPPKGDINHAPNKAIDAEVNAVLSNSFAFGGNNCTIILSKYAKRDIDQYPEIDAVVTGVGCVGVGGRNLSELYQTFKDGVSCIEKVDVTEWEKGFKTPYIGKLPELDDKFFKNYIPAAKLRRLDKITKLAMTSGKQAILDAKLKITPQNCSRIGVVYATGTGPFATINTINEQILKVGVSGIAPDLFTNSVFIATPGQFSIANNIRGPISAITSGGVSGAAGIIYAVQLLKSDQADAIIVIAADEWDEMLQITNEKLGLLTKNGALAFDSDASGMILSEGSVSLILEKKDLALERGAKVYGKIDGYFFNGDNSDLGGIDDTSSRWDEGFKLAMNMANNPVIDYYAMTSYGIKSLDEKELDIVRKYTGENTVARSTARYVGTPTGSLGLYSMLNCLYSMEYGEAPNPGDLSNAREEYKSLVKRELNGRRIRCAAMSAGMLGGSYAGVIATSID